MSEILMNDPLSRMHVWLAKIRSSGNGSPGLRIEHFTRDFLPLSTGVAAHFSQYDDSGDAEWLCLDDACAEMARRDHAILRMLGFHEDADVPMPAFLPALFKGGRIIMERPISEEPSNPGENSFRVALVPSGIFQPPGFHLAVDPLKFNRTCLVSVIGDTFLEWMHSRDTEHVERIDP